MLWISLCVARVRRDCTSHCGMRPSGCRQAIREKRSGTLNPPCEMPGRQLALLWVCLWKSCSHSPLKNAFGGRGKGVGRGRRISPGWRKSQEKALWNAPRRCVAKLWTVDPPMAPPSMLPSIAADFPEKPENPVFMGVLASKGEVLRHFHGHSCSAGFLWKSCWQTVPEAGRRGCPRDSAEPWLGRERSFCRVPPNGCRYLVDKAVGKVLEKMPCQVALMACRVGCFLSIADVAKIAGTVGAEASQGPGWAPDTLWITL